MRRLITAAALGSLVACQASELVVDTTNQPIFGGDGFTEDFDSVCGLYIVRPDDEGGAQEPIYCTGTQIAPAIVLTAASCVVDNLAAGTLSDIAVHFGLSYTSPTEAFGVDDIVVHRYYDLNNSGQHDLALLHLDGVPTAPIFPLSDRVVSSADVPPTDGCGDPDTDGFHPEVAGCVTMVGFGETGDTEEDFGARKRVVAPLTSSTALAILAGTVNRQTCAGDSGGPAFMYFDGALELIAVTSLQSVCRINVQRTKIAPDLDDFIYPYIDRFGATCGLDSSCETSCPRTPDPDCDPCAWNWDDACEEACPSRDWDCDLGSFAGDDCTIDGQCEEMGRCVAAADDDTYLYCTRPCDPAASTCPIGMVCETSGDVDECVWDPSVPSPGSQGYDCALPSDCRSGICEETICVNECTPSADDCPDPYVCGPSSTQPGANVCLGERVSGGGGFCTPSSVAMRAPQTTGWSALAGFALALCGLCLIRRRRR